MHKNLLDPASRESDREEVRSVGEGRETGDSGVPGPHEITQKEMLIDVALFIAFIALAFAVGAYVSR